MAGGQVVLAPLGPVEDIHFAVEPHARAERPSPLLIWRCSRSTARTRPAQHAVGLSITLG